AIQRKNATVLVARIETSGDADPERARALVRMACDEAGRVIARHGGTFVSALGGEVVAVFGLPVTMEDDALRALRAAEELRTSVIALSAGEVGGLETSVGVDTGEVVAEAAGDLFGAPLTQGIALARAARHGEIV